MFRKYLSKLKFELGLNPKIEKSSEYKYYIPGDFKSIILLYADFELAWAWRYSKELLNNKKEIEKIALRERNNVPQILYLCDKYEIPITWATVGHLFLDSCKSENGLKHPEIKRNSYFENDYWKYDKGDWFDNDPTGDYKNNPAWYCPDLIDKILNSRIKHEIACHTFSHIDCRDSVCTNDVFLSEINRCRELASEKKIILKSFVHPGHTIGNLDNLYKSGFLSYRTDYGNILGYPEKNNNGLWEIKGSMELTYRKKWSVEYNKRFYKKIIDRAIGSNSLCVFWFHPSFDKVCLDEIVPDLFEHINSKNSEIKVLTACDYIKSINNSD